MSENYDEYYDLVQSYNIIDDLFFHKVMEDKEASEEMLRIILGEPDVVVEECVP